MFVLPAALPWLDLGPWTGWLVVDEFDLLVLGAIAGVWLRRAFDKIYPPAEAMAPPSRHVAVTVAGFTLWSGIALWRGLADAGSWPGWFDGYAESGHCLRVAKTLVYALLLWPPLLSQLRRSAAAATRLFGLGILCGLAITSLVAVWERAIFPGLFDFSTPYRTVALFWEMHVGGAAIDAYLSMAMPFVVWALVTTRSPWRWFAAAVLALVATYACLTTFSRGVYLAVGLPLIALGLVLLHRRHALEASGGLRRAGVYAALAIGSGALLFGALAAGGIVGVGFVGLLLAAAVAASARRLAGWRHAAGLGLALAVLIEVVVVFGAGTFMGDRLQAVNRDFGGRLAHWRHGVALMDGIGDAVAGIGLGRLPSQYDRFVPGGEFPGAARRVEVSPGRFAVRLWGPRSREELAGLFSLSQRLPLRSGAAGLVEFDAHVEQPVPLLVTVCEMHLLYEARCQGTVIELAPGSEAWQHVSAELEGPAIEGGVMRRPRQFALSMLTTGASVDVTNLQLVGRDARNLLRNPRFADGMAGWLPTAQHYFVPWHIDSLYLELLVERGVPGLVLFIVVVGLALRNLIAGPGRDEPVAPFLATAIVAALIVGLVSSVFDMPRVAWLLLMLVLLAASLGADGATSADGRSCPSHSHRSRTARSPATSSDG